MSTTALEASNSLLDDVDSLLDHHPAQKDPKPGKPAGAGYGPLLRAGTALSYTAWEVYVEEALLETVQWLVDNNEPSDLPKEFRAWVTDQTSDPWAFVGDSWRTIVVDLVRSRLEGDETGRYGFNTASVPKVQGLYLQVLGVNPLAEVRWQKKTNASIRKDISTLVNVRGEIVHRGSTPGALNLRGVRAWADFVRRLTSKFDEQLHGFRSDFSSKAGS